MKKIKLLGFLSFLFDSLPKIENSESPKVFLLQSFTLIVTQDLKAPKRN